jgi:signal transduction histidine kinase
VRRNLQLIASEALHNAARHARARRVELGFERNGGAWRMWVRDDGRGLPPSAAQDDRGNGLRNLRARAQSIGAAYSLDSAPGRGTTIEVVVDTGGRRRR